MAVIVISRTLGSGGEEIARRVAEALEIPHLDREIISRAASAAGVSERSILDAERVPSLLERMAELLGRYPTFEVAGMPMGVPVSPPLSNEWYRRLIEDLLRSIAESGDAVIVGHAAQVILKDCPNALSALIYAPFATCVKRVMDELNISWAEAERQVRQSTRDRQEYIRLYYGANWFDPELYDLIINTDMLGVEGAADVIVEAARTAKRNLEVAKMVQGRWFQSATGFFSGNPLLFAK